MSYGNVWLVDSSRNSRAHQCGAYRYYNYHAGPYGYGYVKRSLATPLMTGIAVHAGLARVFGYIRDNGKLPPDGFVSLAVSSTVREYNRVVDNRELTEEDSKAVALEQSTLLAGLIFGFCRALLPKIHEEYEILEVEQEYDLPLTDKITLCSRLDLCVLHKSSGKVRVVDFKTAASVNDAYVNQWSTSPQLMAMMQAVRQRHKVEEFEIWTLVKGQRRSQFNAETGDYDGPKTESSPLAYAYKQEANPPFHEELWEPRYKYRCQDWQDCPKARGKTKGHPHNHLLGDNFSRSLVTNPEWWVSKLTLEELSPLFPQLGPYTWDAYRSEQFIQGLITNETRWIDTIAKLNAIEHETGWASSEFQTTLDKLVPRSYDCFPFGKKCPYHTLCFKQPGWDMPIESGLYIYRAPHHEQEREQMREFGVPVPDESGEFLED